MLAGLVTDHPCAASNIPCKRTKAVQRRTRIRAQVQSHAVHEVMWKEEQHQNIADAQLRTGALLTVQEDRRIGPTYTEFSAAVMFKQFKQPVPWKLLECPPPMLAPDCVACRTVIKSTSIGNNPCAFNL